MIELRTLQRAVIAGVLACLACGAQAEDAFPTRPMSMVVPFAAGGPTDILARVVGQHMGNTLGQAVVIEDVTGAGGTIGVLATRITGSKSVRGS